jgi:hypothetical protein
MLLLLLLGVASSPATLAGTSDDLREAKVDASPRRLLALLAQSEPLLRAPRLLVLFWLSVWLRPLSVSDGGDGIDVLPLPCSRPVDPADGREMAADATAGSGEADREAGGEGGKVGESARGKADSSWQDRSEGERGPMSVIGVSLPVGAGRGIERRQERRRLRERARGLEALARERRERHTDLDLTPGKGELAPTILARGLAASAGARACADATGPRRRHRERARLFGREEGEGGVVGGRRGRRRRRQRRRRAVQGCGREVGRSCCQSRRSGWAAGEGGRGPVGRR